MKPGYGLQLVQAQRLSLTPELRQAIMVLQMNALELTEFLKVEVQENPLLEVADDSREEPLPESLETTDEEWFAHLTDAPYPGPSQSKEPQYPSPYERYAERQTTLREYLLSQLGLLHLSEQEHKAAQFVVGSLDDNGYLGCPDEEIATSLSLPVDFVARVVRIVQSLDPPGVAARDLRECLLFQARARAVSPLVLAVIDKHLPDLGAGRYKKIAKAQDVSLRDVLLAREIVLSLDPKPGAQYSCDKTVYVVPDVRVERDGDQVRISCNDAAIPRIRWNSFYVRLLETGEPDARAYLQERLHRARCLINSIEQRRSTVLRVMNCVVKHQEGFFREGPGQIQPLTMRDIAEELSIHESTVSRSVSRKHVDTPFGTYPCKMFFSPKVQCEGRAVSQHAVKRRIREMVSSEDPKNPLSDQDIALALSSSGIKVARRTVAKYRGLLGIQPSNLRRKP